MREVHDPRDAEDDGQAAGVMKSEEALDSPLRA
jgi:hypothetical protein